MRKPSIFIVNTDPISLPGDHWIALYMDDTCEHFDPDGFSPRPYFETYLMAKGSKYKYNGKRVQDYISETCGRFCLIYYYFRARNFTFEEILNMFTDNLKLNEIIVSTFYALAS